MSQPDRRGQTGEFAADGAQVPTGPDGRSDRGFEPLYLFGDLLAIARAHWVAQMAARVGELGYPDYRATDALVLRLLMRRRSVAISGIGTRLGVSRQAARKVVDGLQQRGFANATRDNLDGRVVNIALTPAGEAYAHAVISVITALNRELAERVSADDLKTTDTVLRATLSDEVRERAARMVVPPR